jgi:ribosomal protein L37AE/L43A
MTEENESSEIAKKAAANKGEVGGRSTRMFSVCPNCGAHHNTVNDTKGVWICPDCGKPYDPY